MYIVHGALEMGKNRGGLLEALKALSLSFHSGGKARDSDTFKSLWAQPNVILMLLLQITIWKALLSCIVITESFVLPHARAKGTNWSLEFLVGLLAVSSSAFDVSLNYNHYFLWQSLELPVWDFYGSHWTAVQ